MANANLDILFQSLILNFAHLVKTEAQTKSEFLETIKNNYSLSNPKTHLFYLSTERSEFETIKLNSTKDSILFNQ